MLIAPLQDSGVFKKVKNHYIFDMPKNIKVIKKCISDNGNIKIWIKFSKEITKNKKEIIKNINKHGFWYNSFFTNTRKPKKTDDLLLMYESYYKTYSIRFI